MAAGSVKITSTTGYRVLALAHGTATYALDLSARPGQLSLACTCPYAAEQGCCKHLWALLRVTNSSGKLSRLLDIVGAAGKYRFAVSAAPDDGDDDEDGSSDDDLYDYFDDDELDDELDDALIDLLVGDAPASVVPRGAAGRQPKPRWPGPPPPAWVDIVQQSLWQMQAMKASQPPVARTEVWPADRRLVYIIDLDASAHVSGLKIELGTEKRDRHGVWSTAKRFQYSHGVWLNAPDAVDRQIAEMLLGSADLRGVTGLPTGGFFVRPRAFATTLRLMCETGRVRTRSARAELHDRPLHWDDGAPWRFRLRITRSSDGDHQLSGLFYRGDDEHDVSAPQWVHSAGVMLTADAVAAFDHEGAFPLVAALRTAVTLPLGQDPSDFLEQVHRLPHIPTLELPPGEALSSSDMVPTPCLTITSGTPSWRATLPQLALRFRYGAVTVDAAETVSAVFDRTARLVYRRQENAELQARERLRALGVRAEWNYTAKANSLVVSTSNLTPMVRALVTEGWEVSANGIAYRQAGQIRAAVRSGVDWFDLSGTVSYGDIDVSLAAVLDAQQKHDGLVPLADGAMGLVPAEALERMGVLLGAGTRIDGAIRYRRSQLALLDVLLDALPDVDVDAALHRARGELAAFRSIAAADATDGFVGTLRHYQREGLGWFDFLRRFELGGCLADEMGLGKTVQVLALLEARRAEKAGLSLLVVPRSLVFNWLREAARFAPSLRMLDYSGTTRMADALDAGDVDVVITTYGTLRRDVATLGEREFDYLVLDEAQAIKNAGTVTAKACRLVRARHRLALSGTPIENRIEELWSLFEFLNPGMLGASTRFSVAARAASAGVAEPGSASVLSRALRPVILRRTKAMVAPELPARIEQTLEVELEPRQRAFYDKLRRQFQASVRDRVERDGMQKSRMHILEALLRLRQAACHPALADKSRGTWPSAKLDALLPALQEVAADGQKALVFSQFTSFLTLVKARLDAAGIVYEYLDGRTRDRQARVDRFQSDGSCPVFLISLKAGGHGLNLTAAQYVFLLDPWWNPAVEAQAIDRAHRIGQSRRVMATRLVASDTIESKILQLQQSKRQLADAILSEDPGALGSIGREELDLLLS
ncbi:DEAD/DEAH box helicase [Gemmatimonas sp.]|uniref:DEAD/DEAH box helicase n=1 Tax=Gemmatimonas sp. TaxID=1962908 RepID=UPI00398387B9